MHFVIKRVDPSGYATKHNLNQHAGKACECMRNENASRPVRSIDGVMARQSENGRREERPRIPVERSPGQVVRERQNVALHRIRDENQSALKDDNARPATDGDGQLRQVGVNAQRSETPLLAVRDVWRWLHRFSCFFFPDCFFIDPSVRIGVRNCSA